MTGAWQGALAIMGAGIIQSIVLGHPIEPGALLVQAIIGAALGIALVKWMKRRKT